MTLGRLNPGHLILALLLLAAALLAARAVSLALAPMPDVPAFAPPALADRALLGRVDPFFPAAVGSGESLPVTALPFSLHGIRADSATGRGSAIVATGDGLQKVYAVGDSLGEGVTLAAIAPDHVVLDRSGTREALWLDAGSGQAVQGFDPASAGGAAGIAPPPPTTQGFSTPMATADGSDEAPPSGTVDPQESRRGADNASASPPDGSAALSPEDGQ